MIKDLVKASWMSEVDIREQVKSERDTWFSFASTIRDEFDEETKLFNYQKSNKDKVWDSTLFNVHSAMMAREYVDKPTSKFEGTHGQLDIVNNLNAALDIDMSRAEMENLIYDWKHDKFLRGLWIIIRNWWNWEDKNPTFETIDPRLAILDPDGDYRTGEYGFFWFDKLEYYNTFTEENGYENIDNIIKYGNWWAATDLKQQDQNEFKLNANRWRSKNNPSIETYYHFSTFGTQRALIVMTNKTTEIVKVLLIGENKKVKAFQDYLAVTYRRPRRNNPYGDRMPRYVGDVQIVKSIMANLRLDKIRAELYPMYIRNTRLITNKADLKFWFNKIIDANPLEWESLNNALTPVQRDLKTDQSYILDDSLDKQVESSTSIGKIAQWTTPERREAATTNRLVQDSTDINLAFTAKIDSTWYEQLLIVWLSWYKENLKAWDKKLVYIQTGYGNLTKNLNKKDFISDIAVKIKIETKIEIEEKRIVDKVAYQQLVWILPTLPNRPISAQLNSMRNYARSMSLSEENIDMEIPATGQEVIAQQNVWLLLEGKTVTVKDSYDPDTHMIALKAAWVGTNIDAYKYWLLKLKTIKGEAPQEQADPSIANNLVAQTSAQAANQPQPQV